MQVKLGTNGACLIIYFFCCVKFSVGFSKVVCCFRLFLSSVAHDGWMGQQIYPSWSHKVEHFQKIQNNTGIPVKNMLFFDDEDRNIRAVSLFTLLLMFSPPPPTSLTYKERFQFSYFCSCVLFFIVGSYGFEREEKRGEEPCH